MAAPHAHRWLPEPNSCDLAELAERAEWSAAYFDGTEQSTLRWVHAIKAAAAARTRENKGRNK